jgi:hypothetical protein
MGDVADQIGRRLVAGHEQELRELDHLAVAETHLAVLRGEDGADQIVTRLGAALPRDRPHRRHELDDRTELGPREAVSRAGERVDHVVGPALEVDVLLRGDSEHLGDDRDGHRHGETADHVERLAAAQRRDAVSTSARTRGSHARSGAG